MKYFYFIFFIINNQRNWYLFNSNINVYLKRKIIIVNINRSKINNNKNGQQLF